MDRPEPQNISDSATSDAAARLVPVVYEELRRIAAAILQQSGHRAGAITLQATALVHEAYLKMGEQRSEWANEAHFRAVAALAMRRVLADYVRGRGRAKRGGGDRGITLTTDLFGTEPGFGAGELDQALEELEAASPRVATLVVFRFFGELSVGEAAERLGISVSTAEADWRFARTWLRRRVKELVR